MGALGTALALLTAGAVAAPPASASGAAPSTDALIGTEQVLFRSGTGGYGCFRIPTLVRTKTGTLLAFAEARVSPSCADRGPIDTVVRRSTNDGRTWGPVRVVLSGAESDPNAPATRGNASPVADLTTGDVFLLSTSELAVPGGKRLSWVQRSTDDGLTFDTPRRTPRLSGQDNGWFGTGPTHGIQLKRNTQHPGRLVVGAYESPATATQLIGVLYSDDHGDTWQASDTANSYQDGLSPGEPAVAELDDGSLYVNARNNNDAGHRTHAVSADGGTTVPAQRIVPITTPQVQGSLLALEKTYRQVPGDTLVFAAPGHPTDRQEMRLRWSTDRGASWHDASGGKISAQRAGYSDLAELTDGQLGMVYEGGAGFSAAQIYFNRFTPTAVGVPGTSSSRVFPQPLTPAGRTTPDLAPDANDAYLTGGSLGTGRYGQGLALDASDNTPDHANLPYAPALDPGAGDVTYSLFFRYSATAASPQQALLWAYGQGADKPQVWVRAQPGQDRLFAWVQGTGGTASVALPDPSAGVAYGDGNWHHLALTRTGSQVRLSVDGGAPATATGASGPLAAPRADGAEGIRLGAKQDSGASDAFTGSLDEFRLYKTALTDTQLQSVRGNGEPVPAAVRLPFQVIDTADAPTLTQVGIEDDVSGHCADGTLLGGLPGEVDGRVGKGAVSVSATRPGIEVPYLPALDVGADDFTYTLWFSYNASTSTPDAALLWAYGSTTGQPSLWVRAQPGRDRLFAFAETPAGNVQIALPDPGTSVAYGDGTWHLLTLARSGDRLKLSVDGTSPTETTGLTGSLTSADPDGLRVGSKPGGSDVLTGRLDEVKLYQRALTQAETAKVAASAPGSGGGYPSDRPVLWWSMESGNTEVHPVARPATGPATPSSSEHCGHGYVRGNPARTAGRYGNALALDGTDDAVELPYGAQQALGSGDFTLSTWVKYTATASSPSQVLTWAYGVGAGERQLWLRTQPGQDRLAALVQTDTATTMVYAPDASTAAGFGDGAWHHVTLRRTGTALTLAVDGKTLGEAPAPSGSLTYGDAFAVSGFTLGARPDGADRFKGSLDEFRLIRRALSDQEVDALRLTNASTGTATTVRLPFETVVPQGYARM
ncbi:sialidase family protein [Streptomyces sp. NPDC001941]|uniref:sialidase family protein n=1 Tax=Streptomyces sp. NPDC001941 TaxID=3154659 RepID=UPI0033273B03